MRRILVDLARAKGAEKRGFGAAHVPLESDIVATAPALSDLMALDGALDALAELDVRKVRVIELRFIAGLTVEETSEVLNVTPVTVARDWRLARTWLLRELDTRSVQKVPI
jgi:RNA polymerase sigma factor (TIGR02999 family)